MEKSNKKEKSSGKTNFEEEVKNNALKIKNKAIIKEHGIEYVSNFLLKIYWILVLNI